MAGRGAAEEGEGGVVMAGVAVGAHEAGFVALIADLAAFRASRLDHRLSDRALATAAGVSPTTIGAWLRGERFPQQIDPLLVVLKEVRRQANCTAEELVQQDPIQLGPHPRAVPLGEAAVHDLPGGPKDRRELPPGAAGGATNTIAARIRRPSARRRPSA
jgi:transcriptional regulator with XRE-family HTH domain